LSVKHSFTGIVKFGKDGQIDCFCREEDIPGCTCIKNFDCYHANVDIELIRPTEKPTSKLERELKKTKDDMETTSKKIKEGLRSLEEAMKKNKFKI